MKVENKTLLLIAGIVWSIAGFNILKIGIGAYGPYAVSYTHLDVYKRQGLCVAGDGADRKDGL